MLMIVLLLAILTPINAQGVTPFCELCKCDYSTSFDALDVRCVDNPEVTNYLFDEDFWNDPTIDDYYPIYSLTVQNVDLKILDQQFPESDLVKLDLSFNGIAKINHSNLVFANLQKMEELDLSYNELTGLDGEMFRGWRVDSRDYPLSSVKIFNISHNILHTLDQDLFEHLDGVEVLDISHNPFDIIDQPTEIAITNLVYLKELYMENTRIAELPEYMLHTPKYLRVLDLSGNNFNGIPKQLQEAKSLEVLYMNNNPIVYLSRENGFPLIENLKTLHFSHNPQLRYIFIYSLSGLQQLEELHISNNRNLKEISSYALARPDKEGAVNELEPPISQLYLQNNKLSTLNWHLIENWLGLSDLDLTGNPWSCDACENQWVFDVLMPIYVGFNQTEEFTCEVPVEMEVNGFFELCGTETDDVRCSYLYDDPSEKDADVVLVWILTGVLMLIGLPVVLFLIFAFYCGWFSLLFFGNSPKKVNEIFYIQISSRSEKEYNNKRNNKQISNVLNI